MLQWARAGFAESAVFAMGAPPNGGSPWPSVVLLLAIFAIFYFIVVQPVRKKQQQADAFRQALKVGDRVITTGGIYGQITRLGGDSVQLQIADKVRVEIARAAIGGYQGEPQVVEPAAE